MFHEHLASSSLDSRIVQALQRDGRIGYQELARTLGASRATVADHMNRLLSNGAVRVFAAYDPSFLGQEVIAHLSIRVNGASLPVAKQIARRPEAVLVTCISGAWNLVAEVRVGNLRELDTLLSTVRQIATIEAIDSVLYSGELSGVFISRYDGVSTVDEIDRHLISLLQEDGRASYTRLADTVGLSIPAARARIQRLLGTGIIRIAAVELRGGGGRLLSLGLGLTLIDDGGETLTQLRAHDWIEFATPCVGRYDAVATMVGHSPKELLAQLDLLREMPGIRRLESWHHLELIKEDYSRQAQVSI
ncbi:Lrp/AsnC family transcriptional regulator [Glutamicibacter endophyticus]|uniref:Lrp/AsnC family transcriptional regulator n=1 Tax=Glutamicibacter endophyticus TaxID=1522174 RepID=UPI003AEF40D6